MAAVAAHFAGKTQYFAEEYRVRRKDGSWMWIADRGLARRDAEGRVLRMAGSETDITERKELQMELERLVAERTAKLHEMVGELEHFSYSITHDMKSPLRAMRGFAEMACMVCDECSRSRAKEFLGKIPRVFDMFSRESADYEGTGIGLALVRKVAQRMGGKVGVESKEGRGSRFWLELRGGEVKRSEGIEKLWTW